MDFELKSIAKEAVPAALDKAVRYRVLNEPLEAESICRDVLAVDPDNQSAIATLLLALTDQFSRGLGSRVRESRALARSLESEYECEYYLGLIFERRAKCQHQKGTPGCGHLAYEGLRSAMEHYEAAAAKRPAGNDDAVLRWNTCARMVMAHPDIRPEPETARETVELE